MESRKRVRVAASRGGGGGMEYWGRFCSVLLVLLKVEEENKVARGWWLL